MPISYNLGMIAVHIYKCFAKVLWKSKVAKEIGIILHNLFDPIVLSLRQIATLEGEKKYKNLKGFSALFHHYIFLVEYKKYLLAVEPSITLKSFLVQYSYTYMPLLFHEIFFIFSRKCGLIFTLVPAILKKIRKLELF